MNGEIHSSKSYILAIGFAVYEQGSIADEIIKIVGRLNIAGRCKIDFIEPRHSVDFDIQSGRYIHTDNTRTILFFGECFGAIDALIQDQVAAELLPWTTISVGINTTMIN